MVKKFLFILNGQFWSLIILYRWTVTLVMKIYCTFYLLSSNSWLCYFVVVKVSQMQQTVVIETRQTTEVNQSSLILDFDRSVAELRDWLTLLERMLKSQRVTVGDISDIEQTIMKQKVYPRDAVQLIVRYPACFVLLLKKKKRIWLLMKFI